MALESVRRVACESADTVYNSHVNPMPSRVTIVGAPRRGWGMGRKGWLGQRQREGVSGLCCGHFVRLRHAIAIALTCIFIMLCVYPCVCVCCCIVWRFMAFIWPLFICMCVCVRETCAPRVFVVVWHLSPFCILLAYCTHLLHSALSITTCQCCSGCCYFSLSSLCRPWWIRMCTTHRGLQTLP